MERKWYKDWRSWITIILLFSPLFFIGLVLMWWLAPWSRKAKLWITGILVLLPMLIMFSSLGVYFFKASSPGGKIDQAADSARRTDVELIATAAHMFCVEKGKCPLNLEEIKQPQYMKIIPADPKTRENYLYQLTNNGSDCLVKAKLSTGKEFSITCLSTSLP